MQAVCTESANTMRWACVGNAMTTNLNLKPNLFADIAKEIIMHENCVTIAIINKEKARTPFDVV